MSDASVSDAALSEFRGRVRAWLEAYATRRRQGRDDGTAAPAGDDLAAARRFAAALHDAGLAGITWPAAYGGQGLSQAFLRVFGEEARSFELPSAAFGIGMGMVGPTLLELGTEAQRMRYIRPLLQGAEIWCQLFSEPGAGSDVASLTTRAVLDGDRWIVNGQKVWTSRAHFADYGILLARTDSAVPKHRGLTMFIVDMHAPGVTVRPLRDMTGGAAFNEVFFDKVEIPADGVVGEVNRGWDVAVTVLKHERIAITTTTASSRISFDNLADYARRSGRIADPSVRDRLTALYVQERVSQLFTARVHQEAQAGQVVGARGSVGKLTNAMLARAAAQATSDVTDIDAIAWERDDAAAREWARAICESPRFGIAGGTNEVQRNIIGERILGLPKEPSVDRDVAFSLLKVGTQVR